MSAPPSMRHAEIGPRSPAAARLALVLLSLVLTGGVPRRCAAQAESLAGRAEAFGWLARAVAPRDRPRAFALVDRALAAEAFSRAGP